jgi:hypothetical protein
VKLLIGHIKNKNFLLAYWHITFLAFVHILIETKPSEKNNVDANTVHHNIDANTIHPFTYYHGL